jgi:hypothetical protein
MPLGCTLPEQAAEEVDVVEDTERRIEIAAQPLRMQLAGISSVKSLSAMVFP